MDKQFKDQREATVYFRTRGDAALTILDRFVDVLEKQLAQVKDIRQQIRDADSDLGIKDTHIEKQLVDVLRALHPEKTEGLSDEEVEKLVKKGN